MKYHPAASIFPLDEEHIDQLAEDIRKNGLLVPIETINGKIIDGRRRWLACQKAGIDPEVLEAETDDPVGYVLSLNLHRRHLTVSQASMCAARAFEMYEGRAKDRREKGGKAGRQKQLTGEVENLPPAQKARDEAGAVFGVSGKTVDKARRVIDKGVPDLAQAVDAGKLSISQAYMISAQPEDLQEGVLAAELEKRQRSMSPKAKGRKQSQKPAPKEGELQGVGVLRANEAVNCLIRIPKNDPLRKRGFQIVKDWIKANP